MRRDNIKFTRDVLHDFYLKYYWFFSEELPKGKLAYNTIEKNNGKCITVTIGKDIEISKEENLADFIISKMYELNQMINGDSNELNSIISEMMENYSLNAQLLTGNKPAAVRNLNLSEKYVSFSLEESRADQKVCSRVDYIYIDAITNNEILSMQESLNDNYTTTTTIYTPEKNTLQKIVKVYDKKASMDISNKEIAFGFYQPDLIRKIEVTKKDSVLQLYDYEVLSEEDENKNCVAIYELETERSMNEVAAFYIKQLELEKLVEQPIDFMQYKKENKKGLNVFRPESKK